ncbi:HNH endonuclease, partial [Candidatus Bathyarchaeota archaeon]|nr:HNH endonuclease [Candidatus Bathyarchaeota archaeon]
ERVQNVWKRSAMLKQYATRRANGICEGCNSNAPFKTPDGRNYLEVHHINKISDGGPEAPHLVAAVCPNCHRRAHYSNDLEQFNNRLLEIIGKKEKKIS